MLRTLLICLLTVTACMPVRQQASGTLSVTPATSGDLSQLLAMASDQSFSGYYLDIEKTMATFKVSRFVAHELQNKMRDTVEVRAQSFSAVQQKPYIMVALADAVEAVIVKGQYESSYTERTFAPGEFQIVLDLDETLLSHWYKYGTGVGSFEMAERDMVPDFVDRKTGNSKEPVILQSPAFVQMRPGVAEFFNRIARVRGFKGFIIFTAKEDKAAAALLQKWREEDPASTRLIVGMFARNHLRFDPTLTQASKDLRIFDPSLEHVFLIDDNEGRVMQKTLCYKIPKFNADSYLSSTMSDDGSDRIKLLNEGVLPYLTINIEACGVSLKPIACMEKRLGNLGPDDVDAELKAYLTEALQEAPTEVALTMTKVKRQHVFEPGFHPAETLPTSDPYPEFKNFKLVHAEQLKP